MSNVFIKDTILIIIKHTFVNWNKFINLKLGCDYTFSTE